MFFKGFAWETRRFHHLLMHFDGFLRCWEVKREELKLCCSARLPDWPLEVAWRGDDEMPLDLQPRLFQGQFARQHIIFSMHFDAFRGFSMAFCLILDDLFGQ